SAVISRVDWAGELLSRAMSATVRRPAADVTGRTARTGRPDGPPGRARGDGAPSASTGALPAHVPAYGGVCWLSASGCNARVRGAGVRGAGCGVRGAG